MHARDDAADLRRRLVDPGNVCNLLGLKGRRFRGYVLILCPVHNERSPSCSVSVGPDRTLRAHCFACYWNADVFGLIAEVYGLQRDFRAVLDVAADLAGVRRSTPIPLRPRPPKPPPPSEPPPLPSAAFDALAHHLLALAPLRSQPDALGYLERRHIHRQAIEDGWGALPERARQADIIAQLEAEHGRDALIRSGLLPIDDKGTPDFSRLVQHGARIIIPWRGRDGTIETIQRRRLDDGDDNHPRYVAARGRPPHLYGADRVTLNPWRPLAIVEGAFDVLARRELVRLGALPAEDTIGIAGTGAWRSDLLPHGVLSDRRRGLVATDADAAGDRLAADMAGTIAALGGVPERARPAEKDWAADLAALERRAS